MSQNAIHPLHKLVRKRKTPRLIAACDIESIGLGGTFADACIVLEDKPGAYYHFRTIPKLLEFMASHTRYDYFFHNGAGYDFSYFIPALYKMMRYHEAQVALVRQGQSRIIGLQVRWQWKDVPIHVTIRDSLPLLGMSLEKAALVFAPDVPKLVGTIDFAKGETYDKHNTLHRAYLHRDCDTLVAVLSRFAQRLELAFGTQAGWTAGSTAMHAWAACIPAGHVYYRLRPDVEAFCRRGYYGGYVYPGRDHDVHTHVKSVDFDAAYAARMREKGVPCGTPWRTDRFEPLYPGMYHVVAHVPATIPYPCIPSRDADGNLLWATGDFESTLTSAEITFGMERGCTFEILDGYVFPRLEHPFDVFVDRCEELERDPLMKPLAKQMRNSLYGKFGTKLANTELSLAYDMPVDEGYRPVIDEQTGEMVVGLREREVASDANYIHPHWAAWITAQQRIALFELMDAIGLEHVFYCDTDSVKGDADAVDAVLARGYVQVGKGYGSVKVDEEYEWFQCLGTKNYRGKLISGAYVGKIKGIPKSALTQLDHFLAAHGQSRVISFTSINGILARIKRPDAPIQEMRSRTIGGPDASKSWKMDAHGRVRPIHREMQ